MSRSKPHEKMADLITNKMGTVDPHNDPPSKSRKALVDGIKEYLEKNTTVNFINIQVNPSGASDPVTTATGTIQIPGLNEANVFISDGTPSMGFSFASIIATNIANCLLTTLASVDTSTLITAPPTKLVLAVTPIVVKSFDKPPEPITLVMDEFCNSIITAFSISPPNMVPVPASHGAFAGTLSIATFTIQ